MFLVPDFKGIDFFPHGTRLNFMKFKDIIRSKFEKKETLAQIQKSIEPELKKVSTMAPVFAVYYTLNRMGLKKTKLEQKILENESRQ